MFDDAVEEWTEVDSNGVVQREIAFDATGNVVHLFPSEKYRQGARGHFDLAPIDPDGPSDPVVAEGFDRRWEEARHAAEELPAPPSDIELFWRWLKSRIR